MSLGEKSKLIRDNRGLERKVREALIWNCWSGEDSCGMEMFYRFLTLLRGVGTHQYKKRRFVLNSAFLYYKNDNLWFFDLILKDITVSKMNSRTFLRKISNDLIQYVEEVVTLSTLAFNSTILLLKFGIKLNSSYIPFSIWILIFHFYSTENKH